MPPRPTHPPAPADPGIPDIGADQPTWSHDAAAREHRALLSERATGLILRFARHTANLRWFHRLGDPLTREDARCARAYLSTLGHPRASVARVDDFEAAAIAAETLDRDAPAWEAEEHQRAILTERAYERLDADLLDEALREVQGFAGAAAFAAVEDLGAIHGVDDEEILRAAAGAAVQAAHLAALVLATGAEDHAFAHKFRLFETGRWPVALIGDSLHLF